VPLRMPPALPWGYLPADWEGFIYGAAVARLPNWTTTFRSTQGSIVVGIVPTTDRSV
jgi:hypothetical protein